jgi:DNA (cytosine-5)-methyltransferase 1
MKIGSLCTGYGGLDVAVEAYFNAETIWCAEYDKHASKVIEQRFGYINYKDIKTIKWDEVPAVDILTAGYPCQPFSVAGNRKGEDDARHIWPYIKDAIRTIRPRWVIMENVKGHLSLGFDKVLYDLASIGYDARWEIVRAAEVGAPHHRRRLFIVAYPSHTSCEYNGQVQELGRGFTPCSDMYLQDPPQELDQRKVTPQFVEYMMGLPAGWVTDIDVPKSQHYKILGNGVVPQQAYQALKTICDPIHIPHIEIIEDAAHEGI